MNCTFYSITHDMRPYLRSKLKGYQLIIKEEPLTMKNIKPETEALGIFVDSKVDKTIFDQLLHLKLIVTMSTGYDHIDLDTAKKRHIPVCTVPFYGENTVAEHAMALILALSRRLFESVKRVKEAAFDYHGLRGFDVKRKTVGIIGTGHIGIHLIKMLNGFEVTVLAYDAFPNKEMAKTLGFSYVPLHTLLGKSDIISLHTPLLPTTYHLINKKNIRKIKKGAYIINTARGALIEPEALVWGLESGHIAGAGLDVLETEEFLQHPETFFFSERKERHTGATKALTAKLTKVSLMNEVIIDHPRTIVTPHNAFNSAEALQRIFDTTVENVLAFTRGKPQNDVTQPKKK